MRVPLGSDGGSVKAAPSQMSPLASMAVYGLSIMTLKGFSLITIPLYARYLDPAEYGKLDIAVSIIEFAGLCASLGLADTLYRFASSTDQNERQSVQAEIFGSGLLGAAILTIIVQMLVPFVHEFFGMTVGILPLRAGLFAASITGLVEMPLAWMRLSDRALAYLSFIALRTFVQIALTWSLLENGHGAASILYATFWINLLSSAVFAFMACKSGGLRITGHGVRRLAHYGMPLVGGGLAMYALGSFDRLFLAHEVSAHEIGHYAIATKLALATALFVQPLALWWFPKRLAVLDQADGIAQNAKVWAMGFVILMIGASTTALTMPLFVRVGLPPAYSGALTFLPWLIMASLMNELVSLSSVGAFKRESGYEILAVNSLAALIALIGYVVLIPLFGISGAIAATLVAHTLRLTVFVIRSRAIAPVPLVSSASAMIALTSLVFVLIGQNTLDPAIQVLLILANPLAILTTACLTGFVAIPYPSRTTVSAAQS
jgi:O-antigen/teichoic acid export membrane protein